MNSTETSVKHVVKHGSMEDTSCNVEWRMEIMGDSEGALEESSLGTSGTWPGVTVTDMLCLESRYMLDGTDETNDSVHSLDGGHDKVVG